MRIISSMSLRVNVRRHHQVADIAWSRRDRESQPSGCARIPAHPHAHRERSRLPIEELDQQIDLIGIELLSGEAPLKFRITTRVTVGAPKPRPLRCLELSRKTPPCWSCASKRVTRDVPDRCEQCEASRPEEEGHVDCLRTPKPLSSLRA